MQNIQIRLSTTTRGPDGLSSTFADNVGANEVVVYSGSLRFFDTKLETYGIHIALQNPFTYDYHAGNLLMDVRNFATIAPPASGVYGLGIGFTFGDSVSIVSASSASALIGFSSTAGLSTRFTTTPVPEPGTNALLLVGAAACATLHWKRRAARP